MNATVWKSPLSLIKRRNGKSSSRSVFKYEMVGLSSGKVLSISVDSIGIYFAYCLPFHIAPGSIFCSALFF